MKHYRISGIAASLVIAITTAGALSAETTITIDHGQRFQTIEGLGTCAGTADQYLRQSVHQDYYVEDFGASMFRLAMDYNSIAFTADYEDITVERILERESQVSNFVEVGVLLKNRHPDIRLIGSFWTPPAWMKVNGALEGTNTQTNRLREDYEMHYAWLMAAWVELMRDHFNAPLYGLSIQNELLFAQPYVSCVWSPEQYYRVTKELVRLLKERELDVILFGPEHMTADFLPTIDFLEPLMSDPDIVPYFQVAAAHGYIDGIQGDNSSIAGDAFRLRVTEPLGLRYWMTETSGEPHTWDGALDQVAGKLHFSLTGGHASVYVHWVANAPTPGHIESLFEQMQPTKKSYAFQHFSKHIRADAVRVSATPINENQVHASAYIHEENSTLTVVLLNRSETAQEITIKLINSLGTSELAGFRTTASTNYQSVAALELDENAMGTVTLPARSITTYYGEDASFPENTNTLEQYEVEVPMSGGEIHISVTATNPNYNWTAEPNASWIQLLHGDTFTGSSTVTLTIPGRTASVPRTATIRLGDAILTVSQVDIPAPPESIFKEPAVYNLGGGFKYDDDIGYLFDAAYPFVYVWAASDWLYVWPEGADINGFYFFHFGRSHWGWGTQSTFPSYYLLDGSGEEALLTEPAL